MTITRFRWNHAHMRLLLLNPKTARMLLRKATLIANACGGEEAGYAARGSQVGSRARAAVVTITGDAIRDNAENNTMLRNLDAGRG